MTTQTVLLYPHPLLKVVCLPVGSFDEELATLVQDLMDTMRASPHSVGVAAPQIGMSLRVCVVDVSTSRHGRQNNHGLLAMVNPEILDRDGAAILREGCMSVPEYTGDVERATRVVVKFLNDRGSPCTIETTGFEAVAVQHEIDHLDGLLFLDRITSLKTGLFRRRTDR